MPTITEIAEDIVRREGGFVDDPDDPGGATKHGVTLATLKRLGLDLDSDGDTDVEDVHLITPERAVEIFLTHYFEGPGIGQLPEGLHASVFDMYVNAGRNAVRILQGILVEMGLTVDIDGILGPKTLAAASEAFNLAPDHLPDAYGIGRRNYYYRLADARPSLRKYVRRRNGGKGGWILRAENFISKRFHLSAAEHKKRVAKWV